MLLRKPAASILHWPNLWGGRTVTLDLLGRPDRFAFGVKPVRSDLFFWQQVDGRQNRPPPTV